MRKEVSESGKNWTRELIQDEVNRRLPGKSSIAEYWSEADERNKQPDLLDNLWHLGLIAKEGLTAKYPEITPEAIEVIINVQKWAEKKGVEVVIEKAYKPVRFGTTLRQALWIARLHRVVRSIPSLWRVSRAYSYYELLCKLSDTDFDTWEFDRALRQGDKEFTQLIWNVFGTSDENAFQAQFKMHMASQPIKPRELRSIKEITQELKQRVTQRQKKGEA